jgi:Zn-dependent metalloprotease
MRFARARGRVYLRNPVEEPKLSSVNLERLTAVTGLAGDNVSVYNEDYPEAGSDDGKYIYAPDDTHFDEVNVYYHVDAVADYFLGLNGRAGKAREGRGKINAIVHAGDAMDNAYYDPATNGLYFGDGAGAGRLNDLAKEAAVVYHEYTHSVLDFVNPELKGEEADALHEGYADYFGCSLTDDAQIGEWVVAPRGEPHLRDLTSDKKYPHDLEGEAHADGEIWSGACWDLRVELGKNMSDRLVYESMYFLPEFASFPDAATGVLQGDENMFSAKHRRVIIDVFASRGLAPVT